MCLWGWVGVLRPGCLTSHRPACYKTWNKHLTSHMYLVECVLCVSVIVSLTEKILTEFLSSSSQMNLALRLVRRSSSIRGGFTNTTYGLNSDVYTCFIFCGDGDKKEGG